MFEAIYLAEKTNLTASSFLMELVSKCDHCRLGSMLPSGGKNYAEAEWRVLSQMYAGGSEIPGLRCPFHVREHS